MIPINEIFCTAATALTHANKQLCVSKHIHKEQVTQSYPKRLGHLWQVAGSSGKNPLPLAQLPSCFCRPLGKGQTNHVPLRDVSEIAVLYQKIDALSPQGFQRKPV